MTSSKQEVHAASERDNGLPQISWRGDGQFFAVSVIEPVTGIVICFILFLACSKML